MTDEGGGRLRRAMRRLTADTSELDAEDLQRRTERVGAQPVADCADRIPVTIFGTVRAVTIRPRAGTPALEAEVYDGTGTVTIVWLGRRTIAGLGPGRQIHVSGRITTAEGRRLIYNPKYELVPQD